MWFLVGYSLSFGEDFYEIIVGMNFFGMIGVGTVKYKFRYDDALDAFGCNGIGGSFGGIAVGLFGQRTINPAVKWNGLFFGDFRLFIAQLLGIAITIIF